MAVPHQKQTFSTTPQGRPVRRAPAACDAVTLTQRLPVGYLTSMNTRHRAVWAICLALLVIGASCESSDSGEAPVGKAPATSPATTRPAPIRYGRGGQIATLANREIRESSGLACGRVNKGVFWTHNDSGDKPRLFAFNAKGEHLATCEVAGATAVDWEDMCSFELDGQGLLLIGDVGDNNRRRRHCTLYAIEEPRLQTAQRNTRHVARPVQTIHYRYADGPADCESIAFDAETRTVYVVTKAGRGSCKAYALPWPQKTASQPVTLKPVAVLKLWRPTAMDICPGGSRAVVLTYGGAYEYTRAEGQGWAEAFAGEPRTLETPWHWQREAICYGPDGITLYLTSEKAPAPLLKVPVATVQTAPATGEAK